MYVQTTIGKYVTEVVRPYRQAMDQPTILSMYIQHVIYVVQRMNNIQTFCMGQLKGSNMTPYFSLEVDTYVPHIPDLQLGP